LVTRQRLGRELLDIGQQLVTAVLLVSPVLGVFNDLVGRLEAFIHSVRDELAEVVEALDHRCVPSN
jgi:hypothetical protein